MDGRVECQKSKPSVLQHMQSAHNRAGGDEARAETTTQQTRRIAHRIGMLVDETYAGIHSLMRATARAGGQRTPPHATSALHAQYAYTSFTWARACTLTEEK